MPGIYKNALMSMSMYIYDYWNLWLKNHYWIEATLLEYCTGTAEIIVVEFGSGLMMNYSILWKINITHGFAQMKRIVSKEVAQNHTNRVPCTYLKSIAIDRQNWLLSKGLKKLFTYLCNVSWIGKTLQQKFNQRNWK